MTFQNNTIVNLNNNTHQQAADNVTAYFGDVFNNFNNEYRQIHGGLSLTVCVFGIIANVLNIIVLTRKNMISPTNAILTGMAVSDLLVIASYIPYVIHNFFRSEVPPDEMFTYGWAVFTLFHAHNTVVFHTISIWLTVLLAVWRYLTVRSPTSHRSHCSMARAKIAIVFTYAIVPVFCVPVFMCFAIYPFPMDPDVPNGTILYRVDFARRANGDRYKVLEDINFWAFSVLLKLIPCFLLTCLSLALIRILIDARKRKERLFAANFANSAKSSHHHQHQHQHPHQHHHNHNHHHHHHPHRHSFPHPSGLHPLPNNLQHQSNSPKASISLANDNCNFTNVQIDQPSDCRQPSDENSQSVEIDNNKPETVAPADNSPNDANNNLCQNQLNQSAHNLLNQTNQQQTVKGNCLYSPESNSAIDIDTSPITPTTATDHMPNEEQCSVKRKNSNRKSQKNLRNKKTFLSRICLVGGGITCGSGCGSKHLNQNGKYTCCGIRLPIKTSASSATSSPTSSIVMNTNRNRQTSNTDLDTLNSFNTVSSSRITSNNHHHHCKPTSRTSSALHALSGLSRRARSKRPSTDCVIYAGAVNGATGSTNISLPHSTGSSERTTKMLIAVLIMFLVCEFPSGTVALLSGIFGDLFFKNVYNNFGELMDMLALINSAVNFVLYCFMSQQFRKTFSQLFCIRWTETENTSSNSAKNLNRSSLNQIKSKQKSAQQVNNANSLALRTINNNHQRKLSRQLELTSQQEQQQQQQNNSEIIVSELIGDGATIDSRYTVAAKTTNDNNNSPNSPQSNLNCGGDGGSTSSRNGSTSSCNGSTNSSKSLHTETAMIVIAEMSGNKPLLEQIVRNGANNNKNNDADDDIENCRSNNARTIDKGSFESHINPAILNSSTSASKDQSNSNNNQNNNNNKVIIATTTMSTNLTVFTTAATANAGNLENSSTINSIANTNECDLILANNNSANCFNNSNTTSV